MKRTQPKAHFRETTDALLTWLNATVIAAAVADAFGAAPYLQATYSSDLRTRKLHFRLISVLASFTSV